MSYTVTELTYPSSDGKSTVYAKLFVPDGNIRGVIQLSHGMVDHIERYTDIAAFFADNGFVFAGNDHIGHGKTAACDDDFGFFAEKGSIELILKDLHAFNRILREKFPGHKPTLMGHSMGSFLSRLYAEKYPSSINGHIINGTGGPMGAILPFGKGVVKLITLFKGQRHRSALVKKMSFMGYNSHFTKEEGPDAWLTRDIERVSDRATDKRTNFTFTLAAYRDLFDMVGRSNSKAWFNAYPSSLHTLIVSGKEDPVGNYGAGPTYVYKNLLLCGVTDVSLKLYDGARHELFNETNREEYYKYLLDWILGARE